MPPLPPRYGETPGPPNGTGWAPWIGAGLGFLMGCSDYALLKALGVDITWGGRDLSAGVVGLFAITFAALGFAIGRLRQNRDRLAADAAVIARQMRELKQSQARSLELEKLASIGRLAAGVAHEVRNPLAVIRSSAALLGDSARDNDERSARACEFIEQEVVRLDRFVAALLDFSRPTRPRVQRTRVRELVVSAIQLVPATTDGARVAAGQVDDADVELDPDLVTRALVPLIVNGREAAGAAGTVEVSAALADRAVSVDVRDDGPGVNGELADTIFDPFVTDKASGTGLGLSMASRLARAAGGEVELIAGAGLGPDGRGACFRLTVPVTAEASQ